MRMLNEIALDAASNPAATSYVSTRKSPTAQPAVDPFDGYAKIGAAPSPVDRLRSAVTTLACVLGSIPAPLAAVRQYTPVAGRLTLAKFFV